MDKKNLRQSCTENMAPSADTSVANWGGCAWPIGGLCMAKGLCVANWGLCSSNWGVCVAKGCVLKKHMCNPTRVCVCVRVCVRVCCSPAQVLHLCARMQAGLSVERWCPPMPMLHQCCFHLRATSAALHTHTQTHTHTHAHTLAGASWPTKCKVYFTTHVHMLACTRTHTHKQAGMHAERQVPPSAHTHTHTHVCALSDKCRPPHTHTHTHACASAPPT